MLWQSLIPFHTGMQLHHYLWLSTAAAVATILLKTGAWWVTGSIGLLSDAMESFVNLAGATFGLWMVIVARHPPDRGHPLGHGKAEYFSSGFEGILIFGAAAAILWSAVERLFAPQALQSLGLGLGLSVVASAINLGVALAMRRAARQFQSVALEGGARHLMTDVWTTAGVLIGVLLVAASGQLWLDPLVAIVVGLHILAEGARLIRMSADGLMDAALPAATVNEIEQALAAFAARGVQCKRLRTRRAGADSFVYVDVLVPRDWNIVRTHELLDEIEAAVQRIQPGSRVFTHPEPQPLP